VPQNSIPPLNSRLCHRLAGFTLASGAGFLIVNTILWLVPDWTPLIARAAANLQTEPITLTPVVRSMGLACSTLHLSVLVWGLWVARSLFKRLADGLVFEPETGILLRRFGIALVVYAALTPPVSALMSWIVTMRNAPGKRLVNFGISDHEIVLAIVGTLILAIGSVMAEAARMAEENRQIV
jgi:hypothetical protein